MRLFTELEELSRHIADLLRVLLENESGAAHDWCNLDAPTIITLAKVEILELRGLLDGSKKINSDGAIIASSVPSQPGDVWYCRSMRGGKLQPELIGDEPDYVEDGE